MNDKPATLDPEWIKNCDLAFLTHGYDHDDFSNHHPYDSENYDQYDGGHAEMIESLFENGLIIGPRMDQFPGVYMDVRKLNDSLEKVTYIYSVVIIFSLSLLKSSAWHTSNTGYGVVDDGAYCPATLQTMKSDDKPGEVCFHHEVSLDYAECIIVHDHLLEQYKGLVKGRIRVVSKSEFKMARFLKMIDEPCRYSEIPFTLAYFPICNDVHRHIISKNTVVKTLLNFGYDLQPAIDFALTGTQEAAMELFKSIVKMRQDLDPVSYMSHLTWPKARVLCPY